MPNLTPQDLLDASRLRAVQARPYLRKALWALQPVQRPGLGTLGVDKYARMYWDPAVFSKWTVAQVAGVLIHEVAHVLRGHAQRFAHADAHLSNVAGDLEINGQPDACGLFHEVQTDPHGLELPAEGLRTDIMKMPAGLLAEEYYRLLQEQAQNKPADGGEPGHPLGQSDSPSSSGAPAVPSPTAGSCGSCAGGPAREYEDAAPDQHGSPGLSEADLEALRRQTARDIVEHAQLKGRGSVPGSWKRWAESILEPKLPVQAILGAAIRKALSHTVGTADYTYRKRSRRQEAVDHDIVLPGLHQPVPRIAIVVDTSGSMADSEIGIGLGTIRAALSLLGHKAKVTVLACDAKTAGRADVRALGQVQKIMAGGGGTDMRVALREVETLRPRPAICIVVSDCDSPWPDEAPVGVRSNIVVRTNSQHRAPAWARIIDVQNNS